MCYVFIVNPTSGNKNTIRIVNAIEEYCNSLDIVYEIRYTKNPGDATKIALEYKYFNEVVIYSVGGDGTLNEIVNGMYNSKANLSVIPIGTGNDFYKSLKSFNGDKIDIGRVNDKYFINIASIGIDAEVADLANNLKNRYIPSKLIYATALFKKYFSYNVKNIELDGVNKNITMLTICNGKYYGNGFMIAPNAKLNSGVFDVIEVDSINKLKMIELIYKLLKVEHTKSNLVDIYNSKKLTIKSDKELICNIDGEIFKDKMFEFSIKKEAINYYSDKIGVCDYLKTKKLLDRRL